MYAISVVYKLYVCVILLNIKYFWYTKYVMAYFEVPVLTVQKEWLVFSIRKFLPNDIF